MSVRIALFVLIGCLCHEALGKAVFANFLIGNTYGYTQANFQTDMVAAKAVGIDAFGLTIGSDSWTWNRVNLSYQAAQATGFKVFIIFDMNYHTSVSDISNWITGFGNSAAQYKIGSQVFVSTLGGEYVNLGSNSSNNGWASVRQSVASAGISIYFAPGWSAFDATTVYTNNPTVDAVFYNAPWPGPTENATALQSTDSFYISKASGANKKYMAGVSAWYFSHLSYANYLYRTETLWFDRWNTLLTTSPDFIEIMTWNDWGGSNYIGVIDQNSGDLPSGSSAYVYGFPHEALRAMLPAFTSAYKSGAASPSISQDVVIYWYRPSFAAAAVCSDSMGNPTVKNRDTSASSLTPSQVLGDKVFVVALLTAASQVTIANVNTTSNSNTFSLPSGASVISSFFMTSAGQFSVSVTRGGSSIGSSVGALRSVSSNGPCNFNIYANSVSISAPASTTTASSSSTSNSVGLATTSSSASVAAANAVVSSSSASQSVTSSSSSSQSAANLVGTSSSSSATTGKVTSTSSLSVTATNAVASSSSTSAGAANVVSSSSSTSQSASNLITSSTSQNAANIALSSSSSTTTGKLVSSSSASVSAASVSASSSTSLAASSSSSTSGSTTGSTPRPTTKAVFAHFMIGNTYAYTQTMFQNDMTAAKNAGIDAFALNIGSDSWTWAQVNASYRAAAAVGFKVFLSFDMNYHSTVADIQQWIIGFGNLPAQYKYNNRVYVSTFSGEYVNLGAANCSAGWQNVKNSVYAASGINFYFAPDWSAFDAHTVYAKNPVADAIFYWGAWTGPTETAASLQSSDSLYMSEASVAGKQYMAGVSPWFYTHLSYKNYLYKMESLWYDRWQTLLTTSPDFIEIITWNDWGESHYIGAIDPNVGDLPSGSANYVYNYTHEAFRAMLPMYISAYKNGATSPVVSADLLIYWYRPAFVGSINCNDGIGMPTVQNRDTSASSYTPAQVLSDKVFVMAFLTSPAQVTVASLSNPSNANTFNVAAGVTMISNFTMTSSGQYRVSFARNSNTIRSSVGAVSVISNNGPCNFNVYTNTV